MVFISLTDKLCTILRMKLLFPLAVAGLLLLAAATCILARMNWNDKLSGQILSLAFVGTATAFVTVWLSLKGSSEKTEFLTSIVFDDRTHLPPMIMPTPPINVVTDRLSELDRLAHPARNQPAGPPRLTVKLPTTASDRLDFGAELLQYLIVAEITRLQYSSARVRTLRAANGRMVTQGSTYTPVALSKSERIPGKAVYEILKVNRFSDSDFEEHVWEDLLLRVPPGTVLSIPFRKGGDGIGPDTWMVVLNKPNFFTLAIEIAPYTGSGTPSEPNGVIAPLADAEFWRTYTYRIRMDVTFEKLTSGNRRTDEYRQWTEQIIRALESRWSDAHNHETL